MSSGLRGLMVSNRWVLISMRMIQFELQAKEEATLKEDVLASMQPVPVWMQAQMVKTTMWSLTTMAHCKMRY
jgi:hypothetical protein